jgi:ureidoacrylate peracid hydrolase
MASAERDELLDPFSAKQSGTPDAPVDPGRTALLAVDLVNEYLEPEGKMPMPHPGDVVEVNARLAEAAREAGVLIVWIRPGHLEERDGLFRKRIVHALGESRGAQLHEELGVRPGERVLRKRRYSAFFATDLDLYLREHEVERVVCTGVALNICVRATVHDAFFNGYDVWVVPDACRATGPREEESSLYDIATHYGAVKSSAVVLESWR